MIAELKRTIRGQMRARIAALSPERRSELAERSVELLRTQEEWRRARTLMGFRALGDEVDLAPALHEAWESGKVVGLPRYLPESGTYGAAEYRGEPLSRRTFGIHEPGPEAPELPLMRLDFVLVPGVAFDRSGRRLGRGKGFYDRLLARINGWKCGVAFDEQVVETLPCEAHDISMDFLLTPTRWIDMRSGGR